MCVQVVVGVLGVLHDSSTISVKVLLRAVLEVCPNCISTAGEQPCMNTCGGCTLRPMRLAISWRLPGIVTVMGRSSSSSAAAASGAGAEVAEASERNHWPCEGRRCSLEYEAACDRRGLQRDAVGFKSLSSDDSLEEDSRISSRPPTVAAGGAGRAGELCRGR